MPLIFRAKVEQYLLDLVQIPLAAGSEPAWLREQAKGKSILRLQQTCRNRVKDLHQRQVVAAKPIWSDGTSVASNPDSAYAAAVRPAGTALWLGGLSAARTRGRRQRPEIDPLQGGCTWSRLPDSRDSRAFSIFLRLINCRCRLETSFQRISPPGSASLLTTPMPKPEMHN